MVFILDFMKNLFSSVKEAKKNREGYKAIKKSAKATSKKKLKMWIWAGIGSFALNVIIPLVLVATMFIPFSFSYQMLQKISDEIVDGTLKLKATTWDTWISWLSGEGTNGNQYEDYLISTYKRIDEKLYEAREKAAEGKPIEDFDENVLYDKSAAAIGWVYSRIYSATMEPSLKDRWFDMAKSMFSDAITTKTQGKVLKPLDQTVTEIYDPASDDADLMDVATLRLKVFNEVITPYDIQAFDYVGGTLFELLNLDIQELRKGIATKHETEITDKYNSETEDIYKKAIKDLLNLNKELVDEAFTNTNATWIGADKSANQYLKGTKSSFRFKFESNDIGVTWQILSKAKLSGDKQQIIKEAYQVAHKIYMVDETKTSSKVDALKITKEDYNALMNAVPYMKDILYSYIDSTKELSSEEKEDIKKLVGTIHDSKSISWGTYPTKTNKLKTQVANDAAVKEVDIEKDLTDEDFEKKLIQKIKDLKLNRSWKVAETFRDALLELDDSGQVARYYSLTLGDAKDESTIANKLEALYSTDIDWKNGTFELAKKTYFSSLEDALNKMSVGKESNYKIDANGKLIVAGVSGNQNFITGEIKEIVSKMTSYLEQYKESSGEQIKARLDELKEIKLTLINGTISINKGILNTSYSGLSEISSTLKESGRFDEVLNAVNNKTVTVDLVSSARESFNSSSEHSTITPIQLTAALGFYSTAENIADSIKDIEDLNSEYEEALTEYTSIIKEQVQAILNELAKIPTEGEFYTNNTYFIASDISKVTQGGYTKEIKSIGSEKNVLKIQKYKNTIKQAVMLTAQKCYPEKVRELSGKGGGFTGTIQLGDIEIGTKIDSGSYQNAYRYIDYFIKYGNMYGVDPYLLLAKAAQESSGDHESHLNPDSGYGLMQIEQPGHVKTGVTAYNYETKQEEYMAIPNPEAVASVENNIKAGAMIYANAVRAADYNILLSIQGYNYGIDTAKAAVKLYAEEIGKTYEEVVADVSDLGWRKYVMLIHIDINNYVSLYKPWTQGLDECDKECDEPGGANHYGDPHYISHVLQYYNPVDSGGPWVLNEAGEKIQITSDGITTGSLTNGDSASDTAKYFKGKELINWKDYYTATKVFKKVDEWYLSDLDESDKNKLKTSLSQTIIDTIQKYVTKPDIISTTNGLLNDTGVLANLIGKTYYAETGFKPKEITEEAIRKDIETIGARYISAIEDIASIAEDGIDLSFVIYLSEIPEDKRDVAKQQILTGDKNFDKFIKETYLKDKESLTQADSLLTKIVRIITGDKDAKVDSYFTISTGESSSTGKIVDGRLIFYKQWLDAKNTFHETFNAEIDEQIAKEESEEKIQKLESMKLPVDFTFEGAVADDNDSLVKDGLVGKLSLNLKDEVKVDELMMFKKDLTNSANFSTTKNEPKYIVIHQAENTTGGASAKNQYDVYNGDRKSEEHQSMHFSVDSSSIYQWLSEDISAKHIESNTSDVNNSNSIAIEYVATGGSVSEQLQWNLVALCKYLMHKYPSISSVNIETHSLITEADCPEIMSNKSNKIFEEFKSKLSKEGLTFKFEETTQYSGDVGKLIQEAMKHLGKPYVWGGKGPDGFDCSGFVQYVFATALGKSVPAPTWTQMTLGKEVQRADLKPGDLIFFRGGDHVAIYIGEYEGVDSYIHSGGPTSGPNPTAQDKVMIYPMTRDTMTSFRRIL